MEHEGSAYLQVLSSSDVADKAVLWGRNPSGELRELGAGRVNRCKAPAIPSPKPSVSPTTAPTTPVAPTTPLAPTTPVAPTAPMAPSSVPIAPVVAPVQAKWKHDFCLKINDVQKLPESKTNIHGVFLSWVPCTALKEIPVAETQSVYISGATPKVDKIQSPSFVSNCFVTFVNIEAIRYL